MDDLGYGGYCVAGCDTYAALLSRFIKSSNGEYFTHELQAKFMAQTVNRYLFSYGTLLNYKTKKVPKNYKEKIIKTVKSIKSVEFMKGAELYIDSGGFQVSMGAIETENMPAFITEYHDFLTDCYDNYEQAFLLDLPPGPGSEDIFSSYSEIEELNRLSYQTSANMPQHIKDKMIYIHHFRSPALYETWNKFLWEEDLGAGYNYYGTGGIVVNRSTDIDIPVIIYTVPLSSVLRYVKSKGMKSFKFHILGGANFVDIFYHKLFTKHIKVVHDIDVTITYDSSALFKGLAIGRYVPAFNSEGNLVKMNLRSGNIHLNFDNGTVSETIFKKLNTMSAIHQFKQLDPVTDSIYDPETNTLRRGTHMYLINYMLETYRQVELSCEARVDEIYDCYTSGDIMEFDRRIFQFLVKLNNGKTSKKIKAKTYSLYKTLNLLTQLDEDYNKYLVNKFMSSSDLASLGQESKLKF